MCPGAQGFGLISTAFPDQNQGAVSEVEPSELELVLAQDAGAMGRDLAYYVITATFEDLV